MVWNTFHLTIKSIEEFYKKKGQLRKAASIVWKGTIPVLILKQKGPRRGDLHMVLNFKSSTTNYNVPMHVL